MTTYYYRYEGTISVSEGGCRCCIIDDINNYDKPPIALKIPCKDLAKYLEDRSWTDEEERYLTQTWIYDRNLFLQAVEIPSNNPNHPAKVIACADPDHLSSEIIIFGQKDLINTRNPERMDHDDFLAWLRFRSEHGLRTRN